MNYSYVCPAFDDLGTLQLKKPLTEDTHEYNPSDCCDALIAGQNASLDQESHPEIDQVEHWWNRKWQVCLDFYLSTPNQDCKWIKPSCKHLSFPPVDILLPAQKPAVKLSVIEALLGRKTYRKFQEIPLNLDILAALLSECKDELFAGIWRYYLVIFDVQEIQPGIYLFQPDKNGLSLIKLGLFRHEAVKLLCGMSASLTASFLMIMSFDAQEAMRQFPYSRALREIYIDAGRLAQKLLIKGMQHQIGGLPSPAMRDSQMCDFLNLDPNQCIPLYTVTMGVINDL